MGFVLDINYVAILVAAIVGFVIGMLWYSPVLFGNKWMKLMKFSKKDIEKAQKEGMAGTMISAFIAVIILSMVIGVLVEALFLTSIKDGIFIGLLFWVGFIGTTFLNSVLWENQPMELYWIKSSHYLVAIIVMSVIHVLM